jgi:hypothetical protein
MPTGLTAAIYENREGYSFEDFVWRCARHMTPLISMRDADEDAPIPERFDPETEYHRNALFASEQRLQQVKAMDVDAAQAAADAEYEKAITTYEKIDAERLALRDRYVRMIEQVKAWEPPTENHLPLKELMLDQLEQSMRDDTERGQSRDAIERLDGVEWRERMVSKLSSEVVHYQDEIDAENERTKFRNEWLRQLRESLR